MKNIVTDEKGRVTNSLHYPYLYADETGSIAFRLPYHLRYEGEKVIIGQDFFAYGMKVHIPKGWSMMPRNVAYYAHSNEWRDRRKRSNPYSLESAVNVKRYPLVPVKGEHDD